MSDSWEKLLPYTTEPKLPALLEELCLSENTQLDKYLCQAKMKYGYLRKGFKAYSFYIGFYHWDCEKK